MHNPGACIIRSFDDHAHQIFTVRRQRRPDLHRIVRQASLVDNPVSVIADDDHTVVRVQVDSTKLIHAALPL
jgi:hypothetical protein